MTQAVVSGEVIQGRDSGNRAPAGPASTMELAKLPFQSLPAGCL